MLKPYLKCSIVGGIVVFIWYMLSWMIIPWHATVMNRFTDEQRVAQAILESAPTDGVYVLPGMPAMTQSPEGDTQMTVPAQEYMKIDGPFVYANVVRGGMNVSSMARPMIIGIITQIIGAFLITWLMLHAKGIKYWIRVRFVTVAGFTVAFLSSIPLWNWWGFTPGYTLLSIVDVTIAWFLGGLVMAKLAHHK